LRALRPGAFQSFGGGRTATIRSISARHASGTVRRLVPTRRLGGLRAKPSVVIEQLSSFLGWPSIVLHADSASSAMGGGCVADMALSSFPRWSLPCRLWALCYWRCRGVVISVRCCCPWSVSRGDCLAAVHYAEVLCTGWVSRWYVDSGRCCDHHRSRSNRDVDAVGGVKLRHWHVTRCSRPS
jgi:hypothetical protein